MGSDNSQEDWNSESGSGREVHIVGLILRYFWLLLLFGGTGAALSYLYCLKQPPIYQSTCDILVTSEGKQQPIPFDGYNGTVSGRDRMPHAVLIGSPLVVSKAVEKHELVKLPEFVGMGDPTRRINSELKVRPSEENTDVLYLSYRSGDPKTCQAVLAAVTDSYSTFLGDTHQSISEDVLKLITEAKDVLLGQLTEKEVNYQKFRQEAPLIFGSDAVAKNVHKERLAEIEGARSKLIITSREKMAELSSLEEAVARGGNREALALIIRANDRNRDALAKEQKSPASELFPLLLEEQMLLEDLGPDHPKVKALQRRIDLTRTFLTEAAAEEKANAQNAEKARPRSDVVATYIESLRHEIGALQSKQKELDDLFEQERTAAKSLLSYEIQDETHRNDIHRTQLLFNGVVKRLEEMSLVKNYGGYKTSVISAPALGSFTGPILAKYLLVGSLLGLFLGYGVAYILEINDRGFRDPDEVSRELGLTVLGHIPEIELSRVDRKSKSPVDPKLVAFSRPKSHPAEAYRTIRTALYFSTRGERHKVLQVTSPNLGDGKSTTCANLAVSIAQSGKKVLLIDADFRRPRVHTVLGLENSVGMTSVIAGEAEIPDAVQATAVPNLWAMTSGPRPHNPSELLSLPRFDELLAILKEQYDFVLVDTPPLLAVSDPSVVAPRIDGVLLTMQISKRSRPEARRAAKMLDEIGAKVVGVIVNQVRGAAGYRYTASNYGYGRGKDYYCDERTNGAAEKDFHPVRQPVEQP